MHLGHISDIMKLPENFFIREVVIPCLRLIALMMSIDKRIGLVISLSWIFDAGRNVMFIWLDSQLHSLTYQFFSRSAPREIVFASIVKMLLAKFLLTWILTAVQYVREELVLRIKKRLRQQMTLALLESFDSLDFVTQNNAKVIQDFQEAKKVCQLSVGDRISTIFQMLQLAIGTASLFLSVVIQARNIHGFRVLASFVLLLGLEWTTRYVESNLVN